MVFEKAIPYRNVKYLEFIRSLPCCVCKKEAEPHHYETNGMGTKCNDTRTVPLCRACHCKCHTIGQHTFQQKYNISFKSLHALYLEQYIINKDL